MSDVETTSVLHFLLLLSLANLLCDALYCIGCVSFGLHNPLFRSLHELIVYEVWLVVESNHTLPDTTPNGHLTRACLHQRVNWDVAARFPDHSCAETSEAVHRSMNGMLCKHHAQLGVSSIGSDGPDSIGWVDGRD